MPDPIYTITETATILSVSTRTIKRWLAAGLLGCFHQGRTVRILQSDIDMLISNSRDEAWAMKGQEESRSTRSLPDPASLRSFTQSPRVPLRPLRPAR